MDEMVLVGCLFDDCGIGFGFGGRFGFVCVVGYDCLFL